MLPYELVRARRSKGRIQPLYVDLERHGELCRTLIDVFEAHVGLKRAWLESKLAELENSQGDFKLVRGLSALLFRRCTFKVRPNLAVEPRAARRVVFEEARLPPLSAQERAEVLGRAASRLGVSAEALEEALWADRGSEQVLDTFVRPEPPALIVEYNLELAKTLVARASRLRVYSGADWKRVFMLAKRFGLMYRAFRDPDGVGLLVEGVYASSYSDRLEAFFGGLLNLGHWRLVAEVQGRGGGRILLYELDSQQASKLGFGPLQAEERPSFDSELERRFYYAFRSLGTGWRIERESEPLFAGDEVFIPDFTLSKGQTKVFVEIVGFWTKDYLERKARKLSMLKDVDILVLADRSVSKEKLSEMPGVVLFEGDVPLKPVLEFLKKHDTKEAEQEAVALGDVVEVSQLKKALGARYEQELSRLLGSGYVQLGPVLAKKSLLDEVSQKLGALGAPSYEEAEKVCSQLGLPTQPVLESLGYRVRWVSLDRVVVERATG